ncbi:hypothetical protein ONE63_010735 [Megalurothrips usitatus]|uniref:Uncharacterized protein n=1 Tax=Megalurothrips usitatus TaxID=439358 RepID=A0AAV7XII1_9NEOP|nr:hypothetical protein ONE63_010735 [Megalurothrips usitatus]
MSTPWFRTVLGGQLARWTPPAEKDGVTAPTYSLVPVEEALADAEVVALYFPPLLGDDLSQRLAELQRAVNDDDDGAAANKQAEDGNANGNARPRLRVVQVLTPLPASPTSPTSPTGPRAARRLEVPWFAVPPDDYERQAPRVRA